MENQLRLLGQEMLDGGGDDNWNFIHFYWSFIIKLFSNKERIVLD